MAEYIALDCWKIRGCTASIYYQCEPFKVRKPCWYVKEGCLNCDRDCLNCNMYKEAKKRGYITEDVREEDKVG